MKSPISSLSNLLCLYHLISNLLTIRSPVSSLSNLRCLHHSISSLFTMKSPVSSLPYLRCLRHYISSLFTVKSPNSSLGNLQSQYCTSTLSSDNPISAARVNSRLTKLVISHSKQSGLRTVRTSVTSLK